MISIVFIVLLLLLFIAGVPIAFSLGITSVVLMYLTQGTIKLTTISQMMFSGVNSFTILAVPLFLLAGKLMNIGGITTRMFNFAKALVGYFPGGLGHVNVVSSIIFAGMSGTAVSDAGGLGAIEIKSMKDNGFDDDFSCAVTAASTTIGPIIPPSLPMVIYGMMASTSVGTLFIAGIIPGLFMALIMMIVISLYAVKKSYPREAFPTLSVFFTSLRKGFLPLLTPVIIIGGIYSGYFTATEAAVVAVLYSFILSTFVYKEMSFRKLYHVLFETVKDSAVVGIILAASSLYGNVIIRAQIPQGILEIFSGTVHSPLAILLLLNAFLLIVGCFMETLSAITILMPLLLPILMMGNINLIHFGIIMVLNLMIGLLTPPFGLVLFVISRIGDVPIIRLTKALIPWIASLLFALLVLTFCPEITLFLPRVLGML